MTQGVSGLRLLLLLTAGMLCGCVSQDSYAPSASPDQPWVAEHQPRYSSGGTKTFMIPADSKRAQLTPGTLADPDRTYDLPALIDLAQQLNPLTRSAWQQARQAAIAAGMVEASYLPFITASVVAGSQTLTVPLPDRLGNRDVENNLDGTASILSLQWLLFDFGQRQALQEQAGQLALAANYLFNGAHQTLIFKVSQAYHHYGAAIQRQHIADQAVHNAEIIQAAVNARAAQGLATSIETAQADQALAQAQLRQIQANGNERTAYQHLLAAVGTTEELTIAAQHSAQRPLPAALNTPLDTLIPQALSQRADVAASYAALQGSKAGAEAVQAGYLPKIYLGSNLSWGKGEFDVSGLPSIGQQGRGSSILLGVTVPLYDGGLRNARVKEAESRISTAEYELQRIQTAAVTEIVAAHHALRTALASYHAASALVAAAATTYDAALEAYRHGLGTIDTVTVADSALLDARLAREDAYAGALLTSVNLAFMLGTLTSREPLP